MRAAAAVLAALVGGCGPGAHHYEPPPGPGDVYAVIRFAGTAAEPRPTTVSVVWGEWSRRTVFTVPAAARGRAGVVVRLRHYKRDRVGLVLRTNGRVLHGPLQGAPPPQWASAQYLRVTW